MTTTATCHTCGAVIAEWGPEDQPRGYVIVAPGETPPSGNYIVHVCPEQPPYTPPKTRPRTVLDWTDEQERLAVQATLPGWSLGNDDVIFCMSWYDPGYRFDAAPSAPFTVQVRRQGVDLAFAKKGIHFDEVSLTASEALAVVESIGIEPWAQLLIDLQDEQGAEDSSAERLAQQKRSAEDTAKVYARAAKEAAEEAKHAAEHADAHSDDEQLQQVAALAKKTAAAMTQQAKETADAAAAFA